MLNPHTSITRSLAALGLLATLVAASACQSGDTRPIVIDENGKPVNQPPEDGGSTTPPEDGGPVDPEPSPEPTGPTRFLVFGDTGRGDSLQMTVAASMKRVCEQRGGCEFGLMLGDNFYQSGVSSVNDSQWQSKFEKPYGVMGIPFYAVLGNHDYGNSGHGIDPKRAQHEIDYTQKSPHWRMPSWSYNFAKGPIDFFAIDTHPLFTSDLSPSSSYPADQLAVMRDRAQQQRDQLPAQLAQATRSWKIAFGHHPYLSNGPHGNAGRHDGDSGAGAGLPVKEFIETVVCGQADIYFAGHDHSLQDLGEVCGTNFVVGGAGATTTDLTNRNKALFQSNDSGFIIVEATEAELKMSFFGKNGNELYSRTLTK